MTLINIFRQSQYVHIVSDGACIGTDGKVASFQSKVRVISHMPAALGTRGPMLFLSVLTGRVESEFSGFDDLVGGIVGSVEDVLKRVPDVLGGGECDPDFDLFLAGYSESGRCCQSYALCNHDRHGTAFPNWQLVELPEMCIAPEVSADEVIEFGPVPHSAADFDATRHALPLLIAQRRRTVQLDRRNPDSPKIFAGGGFAQVTTIGAGVVQQVILHRWPDVIGERIDPTTRG